MAEVVQVGTYDELSRPEHAGKGRLFYVVDPDPARGGWYEHNGTAWQAADETKIATLRDVDLTGIANGDLLHWDAAAGKVKPVNSGSITVPDPGSYFDGLTLEDELQQLAGQEVDLAGGAASLADLVAGATVTANQQTALTVVAFVCPFACSIVQASIVNGGAIAASDSSYWTVTLLRYRAGSSVTIATKTTKTASSGGEAMGAIQEWPFDLVAFDTTYQVCERGDVVAFVFTPTSTPTAIVNPRVQVRYEPS